LSTGAIALAEADVDLGPYHILSNSVSVAVDTPENTSSKSTNTSSGSSWKSGSGRDVGFVHEAEKVCSNAFKVWEEKVPL